MGCISRKWKGLASDRREPLFAALRRVPTLAATHAGRSSANYLTSILLTSGPTGSGRRISPANGVKGLGFVPDTLVCRNLLKSFRQRLGPIVGERSLAPILSKRSVSHGWAGVSARRRRASPPGSFPAPNSTRRRRRCRTCRTARTRPGPRPPRAPLGLLLVLLPSTTLAGEGALGPLADRPRRRPGRGPRPQPPALDPVQPAPGASTAARWTCSPSTTPASSARANGNFVPVKVQSNAREDLVAQFKRHGPALDGDPLPLGPRDPGKNRRLRRPRAVFRDSGRGLGQRPLRPGPPGDRGVIAQCGWSRGRVGSRGTPGSRCSTTATPTASPTPKPATPS